MDVWWMVVVYRRPNSLGSAARSSVSFRTIRSAEVALFKGLESEASVW